MVRDHTSVNKPSKIVNNVGNVGKPCGIAFSKNGMWAVADNSNHCVYVFDSEDQLIREFGSNGFGNGQFNGPQGVAFYNDNHLYVADCVNHRIQSLLLMVNTCRSLRVKVLDTGNYNILMDSQYTIAKCMLVTVTIIVFQYFKLTCDDY